MKQQVWSSPKTTFEEFVPQNYIAACGDENKLYKFECNSWPGFLYYYPDSDGDIDGDYTGDGEAVNIGIFTPCDASHEAEAIEGTFYDGYIIGITGNKRNVIVWRGEDGTNGHATADLDMDSWETAKS